MNLLAYFTGLSGWGWLAVSFFFSSWLLCCFRLGAWSEHKAGDRETGVLIGFFVPTLIFLFIWWLR